VSGKILHRKLGTSHILKPIGAVRVSQGPVLSRYLEQLTDCSGLQSVIIDLSDAESLDSTALGFLAKIAIATHARFGFKPTLLFAHEDISRVLDSMGFHEICVMLKGMAGADSQMVELIADQISEASLREQVLDAHKTLMHLNAENEQRFCDLVGALESEVQQAPGAAAC
jgi:anti-anti-sigma regulatory factor